MRASASSSVSGISGRRRAATETKQVRGDRPCLVLAVGVVISPLVGHVVARFDRLRIVDPAGQVLEVVLQYGSAHGGAQAEVGQVGVLGVATGVAGDGVAAHAAPDDEPLAALLDERGDGLD